MPHWNQDCAAWQKRKKQRMEKPFSAPKVVLIKMTPDYLKKEVSGDPKAL